MALLRAKIVSDTLTQQSDSTYQNTHACTQSDSNKFKMKLKGIHVRQNNTSRL